MKCFTPHCWLLGEAADTSAMPYILPYEQRREMKQQPKSDRLTRAISEIPNTKANQDYRRVNHGASEEYKSAYSPSEKLINDQLRNCVSSFSKARKVKGNRYITNGGCTVSQKVCNLGL